MLRGISSGSDDVDEDDDREAELDLVSEDELDSIVTTSAVCGLKLPSGASEHPASSCATSEAILSFLTIDFLFPFRNGGLTRLNW